MMEVTPERSPITNCLCVCMKGAILQRKIFHLMAQPYELDSAMLGPAKDEIWRNAEPKGQIRWPTGCYSLIDQK